MEPITNIILTEMFEEEYSEFLGETVEDEVNHEEAPKELETGDNGGINED